MFKRIITFAYYEQTEDYWFIKLYSETYGIEKVCQRLFNYKENQKEKDIYLFCFILKNCLNTRKGTVKEAKHSKGNNNNKDKS